VACFSQRGRDLLQLPGVAWLREVPWPVHAAILDRELVAETGADGIQAVFEAPGRKAGRSALVAFDVLKVEGSLVQAEPWRDRQKRLEDVAGAQGDHRVTVPQVTEGAVAPWAVYVELGGEAIVLKDSAAPYRPGERSAAWLKVKRRLTLPVEVHDGDPGMVPWGDWGWVVRLRLTYRHPSTGA
jgi:ATP-dependent DNA ligase